MTFSNRRISLIALATLLSTALLLVGSARHADRADHVASAASAASLSWDVLARSDQLRSAEAAYRACSREAALFHLPLKEFPEVSERVTFLRQDGKLLRKSESVMVDIDGMQIDNGCATRIVKAVSVDVVGNNPQARVTIEESGRSVALKDPRETLPMGDAKIQRAIARRALAAPICALTRDPGPQSHFMMLNLCRNEERRAELEQRQPQERQVEPHVEPKRARATGRTS